MKNILVPCDFSKPSEEAFKLDVSIASQSKGEVHVLHVFDITYLNGNPTLANSYGFNVDFLKEIERAVEQKKFKSCEDGLHRRPCQSHPEAAHFLGTKPLSLMNK